MDLGADLTFNRKLQFSDVFIDPINGDVSADSDLGEFGFPEWEGQGIFRADIGDYRATWSTRYISSVRADADILEANGFDNWRRADLPWTDCWRRQLPTGWLGGQLLPP